MSFDSRLVGCAEFGQVELAYGSRDLLDVVGLIYHIFGGVRLFYANVGKSL